MSHFYQHLPQLPTILEKYSAPSARIALTSGLPEWWGLEETTCIQWLWALPHLLVGEESAGGMRQPATWRSRASGRQGGRRDPSQPGARPSSEIGRRRPQAARAVYLVSEHTHYPAAESGCSRSRPPAWDIVFQPRLWHRAQALAPASSPCLCSRLALGAQPSRRRRRRAPGAGARSWPQGRRGRPCNPCEERPSRGPRSPARSAALELPDLPIPDLSEPWYGTPSMWGLDECRWGLGHGQVVRPTREKEPPRHYQRSALDSVGAQLGARQPQTRSLACGHVTTEAGQRG